MGYQWEVVFEPNQKRVTGSTGDPNDPGTLRVDFDPGPGQQFNVAPTAGGGVRITFYGKLRLKSIPDSIGGGSYEIPNGWTHN